MQDQSSLPKHTHSPIKPFLLGLSVSVLVIASALGGAVADRLFVIKPLDGLIQRTFTSKQQSSTPETPRLNNQENSIVSISETASKSVVTISIKRKNQPFSRLSPFGFFGFSPFDTPNQGLNQNDNEPQDIGTGFVVDSKAGLIITNKHVISDTQAEYFVEDKDGNQFIVKKMYRDPANDIGIILIEGELPAVELGDSDQLKVGQSVIAIGTALGEFRHTVTTGVISGLGRGITASDGSGFSSERLDNVIQTDAAINPGNSGGPLLNSEGKVIGVNSAVAGNAQNIGFAIPINIIKESLDNFNRTGKFERPFFGVQYQMISKKTALMNNLPQGAYVVDVVPGTSASEAGITADDIITKFDGTELKDDTDLAKLINNKKVGDSIELEYYRDGEKKATKVTLKERQE